MTFVVLGFVGCNSRELVPVADERSSIDCDSDEAFELVGSRAVQFGDLCKVRTTKRPVIPDRRDECLEMVRPYAPLVQADPASRVASRYRSLVTAPEAHGTLPAP